MGFFDKIRSGLRSIGERLHLIERKVDESHATRKEKDEIQRSLSFVERKMEKLETQVEPKERIIEERFSAEPIKRRRTWNVVLRYRPVGISRGSSEHGQDFTIEAEDGRDAIALAEEQLEDEPEYYFEASATMESEDEE